MVSGKFDGKFDDFSRTRRGLEIAFELLRREDVCKQIAELDFAPSAAGFHIAQDALEIDDVGRDRLHFAEGFMDVFETLADEPERFGDALFQSRLELFVHDSAHFIQFFGVFFTQGTDGIFHRNADAVERAGLFRAGLGEGFADERKLPGQRPGKGLGLNRRRFCDFFAILPQGFAGIALFAGKGFGDAVQGFAVCAFKFALLVSSENAKKQQNEEGSGRKNERQKIHGRLPIEVF